MPNELIIYTTSDCSSCRMAKGRFAREGLEYREINVEEDEAAATELKQAGYTQAPVIRWRGRFHTIVDLSAVIKSVKEARAA
jgi:glutaredoxin